MFAESQVLPSSQGLVLFFRFPYRPLQRVSISCTNIFYCHSHTSAEWIPILHVINGTISLVPLPITPSLTTSCFHVAHPVIVVVGYATPSEGWGHGGTPWSPRSRATPQGLDQRS